MKALFDIGNTRVKWAWLDANRQLHHVGDASHMASVFDQIAASNWSDWPPPEQVIVSSVAADKHWQQLSDWCLQHWQIEPVRVTSTASQCGVSNAYIKPGELGSDRWAAMIGAHHLLHMDTCVIDCGTAMTVDFLDATGQHLGGYIIPGLSLMQQSLVQRTDAIQLSSLLVGSDMKKDTNPGKSTAECIEHGVLMAASGLIEAGCEKMKISTGRSFRCLFTGGNAKLLASCADGSMQLEPHLVLLGLAQIATENRELKSTNRDQ